MIIVPEPMRFTLAYGACQWLAGLFDEGSRLVIHYSFTTADSQVISPTSVATTSPENHPLNKLFCFVVRQYPANGKGEKLEENTTYIYYSVT